MKSAQMLVAGLLAATNVLAATGTTTNTAATPTEKGVQEPSSAPTLNVITVQGCYDSPGDLVFNSTLKFNAKGSCAQDICFELGYPVAGTSGGNQCYCGKKYPPKSSVVKDENCNVGCTGFDVQACGGVNFWTIYNTGLTLGVESSGDSPQGGTHGKGSSPDDSPTAVMTVAGSTVVVTQVSSATPQSSGPNVGAIAGGVVVGVVALAGAIGGIFLFIRQKRNKEIEEEHRRNAAVSSFTGKSSSSLMDARLDPVMAQRRLSDGSIADNQDYSRKILRVTNA